MVMALVVLDAVDAVNDADHVGRVHDVDCADVHVQVHVQVYMYKCR